MAKGKKLVIEATLHELVPKSTNPHVPYGPEEVAPDAAACVRAGLSFLHFHARDSKTGEQLWTDPAPYKKAILLMRQQGVPAALPWYPTYKGVNEESFRHVATLAADPEIRLEMAAIDVGTDNLNDYNPKTKQFVNPDSVKTLSHSGIKYFFDLCRQLHQRPYLGIYEPGQLRHIGTYLDMGWLEPPIVMKFFFSDYAPFGLPPTPRCVGMYAEMVETVLPGIPVEWFVMCYGHSIWELAPAAIDAGGHVRVGLGQYHPWNWPDPTGETPTNAEQVARVAALAKSKGRELATPADTRQLFGLRSAPTAAQAKEAQRV